MYFCLSFLLHSNWNHFFKSLFLPFLQLCWRSEHNLFSKWICYLSAGLFERTLFPSARFFERTLFRRSELHLVSNETFLGYFQPLCILWRDHLCRSFSCGKLFNTKIDLSAITTKTTLIVRLVHAITPLEENKSFLEKVQLAGKLCGVEAELWNKQKEETTQQKKSSTSSVTTQVKGSSEDISDSDSDDPIISLPSSHIKWSEKREKKSRHQQQQPKSRLMPSFTKKCLEFHNCPEAVFPKAREKGNMHFSLRDRILKENTRVERLIFVHHHHPQCLKIAHKGLISHLCEQSEHSLFLKFCDRFKLTSARFFERTLFRTHALSSARFFERTLYRAHAQN